MNSDTQAPNRTDLIVDVGPVAHGGHCVARHEGRVVFVRHGIPGERVKVRLTESGADAKFWRGDVVEVLDASPDRVAHFWDLADSARSWSHRHPPVGGAELGHIALTRQRSLKAEVLAEQLHRLAGVELPLAGTDTAAGSLVEAVGEEGTTAPAGLGWRTRAGFAVTPAGKLGMHAHRSDTVLPVREMPLAVDAINNLRLWDIDLQGIERIEVAAPANGSRPLVLLVPAAGTRAKRLSAVLAQLPDDVSVASFDPVKGEVLRLRGRTYVQETAAGHDYRVTGDGFWQIHREAPAALVGAVTGFLHNGGFLEPGAVVADLYAGVGLFTAPLADAVGATGSVLSVEGAPGTSRDARKNLHDAPQVEIVQGRVERVLREKARNFDAILLDPPRAGAGKAVVNQLIGAGPRAVAYVSCDPASFARDVGYFQQSGWELAGLRAFDLYPHTHHMETVALLTPRG
ncbi:TRAM domain-containing protein [Arthrobacter sp. AL08]|uniref:class I SAM-dependent RNA methyltransferase n=1 Tax=Micrococcaceae TaxID=1268 RepID=UPI001CFF6037|nr:MULTISPECIES: TRAM domain-containing protein [Micrococcaceae]MCB5280520.1 23S rRNA (uracil(1939)-C(5))-methyltransferase RlmD [Arthrobacter sp. ES1]MDI3241599.1 TRAM domain-containing protein [Arthrobacter sp. AL05]MDI3277609.1 TRAM domain-containing protein [Arthrobacter sp. AL08]MDJ0353509.1 TRAM domain-containing protein [Pseudarthrobacter sp. PH31-O2]WGZ80624.1 TRAM domain-containing protein [Arthrobacter sp. EM1]